MNKKMRCMTAFVSVCIFLASGVFCGCTRETVYRLSDEEISSEQAEEGPPDPADAEMPEEPVSDTEGGNPEEGPETIWVYVCGAVQSPGVYELSSDSRVFEALEAAGGVSEDAELRSLRQHRVADIAAGLTVYTVQEIEESGGLQADAAQTADAPGGKVNLNTAGKEELMTLSGIGEARAQAILTYREEHGPFLSIEEIMNIEGIKEKSFSKIKDEIEV